MNRSDIRLSIFSKAPQYAKNRPYLRQNPALTAVFERAAMTETSFSNDRKYRFMLVRKLGAGSRTITWCMLNPSTADENDHDSTIRRCMDFSKRWGFDKMIVVNLSPLVETDSSKLKSVGPLPEDIRERNETAIKQAVKASEKVVMAYGNAGNLYGRDDATIELLREMGTEMWCLGTTQQGAPRHPLRLPKSQELEEFQPAVDTDSSANDEDDFDMDE